MHELSIAISIVAIASEEIKKAGGSHAEEIVLEIGDLSGIEKEALNYAWQEAIKNTELEKTNCIIETVAGLAKCLSCNNEFALNNIYDLCPLCNDFRKEIKQGKELKIKSLTIL